MNRINPDRQGQVFDVVAQIDTRVQPNRCAIKPIEGTPWVDMAYFLECSGFLASLAMREKQMTGEAIADYCRDYILKCVKDYQEVKPKDN